MCYHVKFGRFASKGVLQVNKREPQNRGALEPRLLHLGFG